MTLGDLDLWLKDRLDIPSFESIDSSLNGLQLGERSADIRRIALAVDACRASMERARTARAQMLLVHHGLFWGKPLPLTGSHLGRVRFLLENDLALYAVHLPLDAHLEVGNNAVLAEELGLRDIEGFGRYKGRIIGRKGRLPKEESLYEIKNRLFSSEESGVILFPFGKEKNETVGLISGDAPHQAEEAKAEGLDLYITGEPAHAVYHYCMEEKINMLAAGHYQTETGGLKALGRKIERELGLETVFIDVPTGL